MEPEGSLPHSQEPTTCPIQSQINPVHASIHFLLKIHLNIILPSMPGSFPQVSPPKLCLRLSPTRATCPAHLILLDLITQILLGEQ